MVPSGPRAVCVGALLWCFCSPVRAQLIPVKTLPLAQGDQFQIFPSNNLGIGSVSIALDDSLHDPFVNPATGARLRATRFFSAPTVYSVSRNAGGGRSLPVAVLARSTNWYGGLSLVLQQVDPSRTPQDNGGGIIRDPPPPVPNASIVLDSVPPLGPDLRAKGNRYVFGMLGRAVPGTNFSLGASALWTDLHAVDGVDLLYAGSRRVGQHGHVLDLRLGALKQWPGELGTRTLEAVVLHNRFAATHDVIYADLFWDPGLQQLRERARNERNYDHTITWGLQVDYAIPLTPTGWRIGWLGTVNRSSHPKIPSYQLANVPVIPRDPGYTTAFDAGIGISKVRGPATFGADLIYEPIRSYTWADAAEPVSTAAGDTIPAGGKTVSNRFRFSNALFRFGIGRDTDLAGIGKAAGLQFGLITRWIHYTLLQTDYVLLDQRHVETGWMEWTPTWGLSLRFPEFELRYRGCVTKGASRPFVQFNIGVRDLALAGSTILAAPTGPLSMTDVNTATHQISLSLPLR